MVVREIDGTLRTATPDEHDRMNRVYYEKAHRLVNAPAVFSDTGTFNFYGTICLLSEYLKVDNKTNAITRQLISNKR